MAMEVKAGSLTEITQIASNPPNYPRNPTVAPREPLVLYIARVPGCRDLILTTIKPFMNNVTAEDIASSLYYLHHKSPDDPAQIPLPECVPPPKRSLSRKPLPESAKSLNSLNQNGTHRYPISCVRRKPVGSETASSRTSHYRSSKEYTIPPGGHPSDPRASATTTSERNSQGQFEIEADTQTVPKSHLNTYPLKFQDSTSDNSSHLKSIPLQAQKDTFSLTIVRRDPSSGAQWNIGNISGHPRTCDLKKGWQLPQSNRKPYFDISISLTTPGYLHFRNQANSYSGTSRENTNPTILSFHESNFSFERTLKMEGKCFWSRSSEQHQRLVPDLPNSLNPGQIFNPWRLSADNSDGRDGKGYLLYSPWGGRCKFLTGSDGRSLRCHHTLPPPTSTSCKDAQHQTMIVSELRFDIRPPSTSSTAHSKMCDAAKVSKSKINMLRNKTLGLNLVKSPLPPRSQSSLSYPLNQGEKEQQINGLSRTTSMYMTDERDHSTHKSCYSQAESETDDAGLDLSIGREKAGGGTSGNRAKLGKIIVYDEGIKMLDLIISANMGIWWSIWGA